MRSVSTDGFITIGLRSQPISRYNDLAKEAAMRTVLIPGILAAMLAGCSPAELKVEDDAFLDVDTDGDGLTDSEEEELGSNPEEVDSDGDGFEDGVEADWYTDPTNPQDHPYEGGWPIDSCRNDLVSSGMAEGDVINDVKLLSS